MATNWWMVVGRGLTMSTPSSSSYRRPSSGIRSSSATVNGRPAAGHASAIVTTLMVPPSAHSVHFAGATDDFRWAASLYGCLAVLMLEGETRCWT